MCSLCGGGGVLIHFHAKPNFNGGNVILYELFSFTCSKDIDGQTRLQVELEFSPVSTFKFLSFDVQNACNLPFTILNKGKT